MTTPGCNPDVLELEQRLMLLREAEPHGPCEDEACTCPNVVPEGELHARFAEWAARIFVAELRHLAAVVEDMLARREGAEVVALVVARQHALLDAGLVVGSHAALAEEQR